MIKKIILPILALAFFFSCNSAKNARIATTTQGNVLQQDYFETVPFNYYSNLIFLPVEVNGKTYQFLFDTGNDLTVIDDDLLSEINYKSNNVEGDIYDANNSKRTLQHITIKSIKLGAINFQNIGAQVTDLSSLSSILGCVSLDAVIGSNFIRKAKWQIDYMKKEIRFSDNINSLTFNKSNSINIKPKKNSLPIDFNINGNIQTFTIDTGCNSKFISTPDLFEELNKNESLDYIISEGVSFGAFGKNTSKSQFANIKESKIGFLSLKNQVFNFKNKTHNLIGNEFLENFIFTIDWTARQIYLDPIELISEDSLNKFPIGLTPNYLNNSIQINRIWDLKSTNFNLGDTVLKINNFDVSNFDRADLCDFWKTTWKTIKNKENLEIQLEKDGKIVSATLDKKKLLNI